MKCKKCQGPCAKKGCQNRRQKYYCKKCNLYQLKTYQYKQCTKEDEAMLVKLNNEGVSISGISRITGISKSHVINKLKRIASSIQPPIFIEEQQEYEIDEMHTFIGQKSHHYYITYAINRTTRKVIDFVVGSRTKENIGKVVNCVKLLNPKRIFTDRLNIYPSLIGKPIHVATAYRTNHIERLNLTLRTHLKRLSRKTICFSRSAVVLTAVMQIYFWGESNSALGMERHV